MGIKNIHIVLISASSVVALAFGLWALGHDLAILGLTSILAGGGLIIYCLSFIRKAKTL